MIGGSYDGKTIDGTLYTDSVLIGGDELFEFEMYETLMILDADGNEADLSNYGNSGPGGGQGMDRGENQDGGPMNPEDILLNLPIVNGILTLSDGTTYEVPQGEDPMLIGETIVFSNGVEVSIFQIMGGMKDRGEGPPKR